MTHDEAIDSLIQSCNDYAKIVEQLQEENAFLTDTIEKNNLGQIKSERRSLLSENEQCKRNADIAIKQANQIKSEYESKISDADDILVDARKKQSDIYAYIDEESDKKIQSIKDDYAKHKENNDKILKKHIAENDTALRIEKNKIQLKSKKMFIITIVSIVFGIISLLTHLL